LRKNESDFTNLKLGYAFFQPLFQSPDMHEKTVDILFLPLALLIPSFEKTIRVSDMEQVINENLHCH
jgi:hypothetical protein